MQCYSHKYAHAQQRMILVTTYTCYMHHMYDGIYMHTFFL